MKMAELRIEVTEERRKSGKLEKEVGRLKDLVKELQEDDEDEEEQDKKNAY